MEVESDDRAAWDPPRGVVSGRFFLQAIVIGDEYLIEWGVLGGFGGCLINGYRVGYIFQVVYFKQFFHRNDSFCFDWILS